MDARATWWVGSALALVVGAVTGCGSATPTGAGVAGPLTPPPSSAAPHRAGEPAGETVGRARDRRRRGSEAWRITRPSTDHQVEAYTTHASGLPGTRVGLKVSTTEGGYEAAAYRIGAYLGGTGAFRWESGFRARSGPGRGPARAGGHPHRGGAMDAGPDRGHVLVAPGVLRLHAPHPTGWETQVPYVVTSPSARGTVALVSPVTTWQAYNAWGGYSLYEGPSGDREGWAVSFDRPYNGATGANDYRTAAIPIIVRAERTGEPLSYFTNVDLHTRPGSLDGARGYVSMGHDEYWTPTMRDEVMRARDAGTNLAFLGANTMYWRVRLEDRPTGSARVVVGYRNSAHLDPWRDVRPAEATSRFRDAPVARPEHDLLGVQYECYPVDVDLVVASPRWWGFRGTGVRRGDRVPGLIGPEADRVYPDDRLPRPLEVLGHTPYECRGVATSAQTVYYTAPSGAGVFTAGTLRWGCALVDRCERALGDRTAEVRRRRDRQPGPRLRAGPGRREHPRGTTSSDFHLPTTNAVSAS